MTWPTPQDYNEAIQHPRSCFSDGELRRADVWLTPLGLPRPITGNFATVYRLASGGKDWAVRCFWREVPDFHYRYEAISKHLHSARLPYTVGFEYLQHGIQIKGIWYPAVKMEWIEGQLLLDYVHQNLGRPDVLAELARRWVQMCECLERARLAHGDLQHGNVLVSGGALKLVDYDGMFVPDLAGRSCHELGHQNYQHPGRSGRDFGPELDRFSQWLVYLCLLALSVDPSLWSTAGAGDERLILGEEDLRGPEDSATFQLLLAHSEPKVRSVARALYDHLSRGPLDVPPLTAWEGTELAGRAGSRRSIRRTLAGFARVVPLVHQPAESSAAPPEWVVDMIRQTMAPRRFEPVPAPIPRAWRIGGCLALAAGLSGAVNPPWMIVAFIVVLVAGAGLLVAGGAGYLMDTSVRERRRLAAERRAASSSLADLERAVSVRERTRQRIEARRQRQVEALAARRARCEDRAAARHLALARMLEDLGGDVARSIARIEQASGENAERMLQLLRDAEVGAGLRRRRIWSSRVDALALRTRLALWLSGIRSAADVSSERLQLLTRCSPETRRALARWRVRCELDLRAAAMQELPSHIRTAAERPYTVRVDVMKQALMAVAKRGDVIDRAVQTRLHERVQTIDEQIAALDAGLGALLENLELEVADMQGSRLKAFWQVKQLDEELAPFQALTLRSYLGCVIAASLGMDRVPGLRWQDGNDQPDCLWPLRRRLRQ